MVNLFFEGDTEDHLSPYTLRPARCSVRTLLMMMIAFITINSGLVPLIEGVCAQI